MSTDLFVVPTMDCEPPNSEVSEHAREWSPTGPESYEQSAKAIRGHMDVCEEYGLTPTYFFHPEVVKHNADTVRDLRDEGACLGMHLHPYKLDEKWYYSLGHYGTEDQRQIIEEAIDVWQEGIDEPPNYFRAGGISINDYTFRLLEDIGFRGGSTSLPGYVNPPRCINWAGAELHPHRAHLNYRQGKGDGEFVEVPYIPDLTQPRHGRTHPQHYGYERLEIKPDGTTTEEELDEISRNILERIVDDAPDYPTIMTNAHNNFDYSDPDDEQAENMHAMFQSILDHIDDMGLSYRTGTVETVIDEFLAGE